jgi:hypothetical protein
MTAHTHMLIHWRRLDEILTKDGAAPATMQELRTAIEHTATAEDAALLIQAMRLICDVGALTGAAQKLHS